MEGMHIGHNIGGIKEVAIAHIDDLEHRLDAIVFKPNKWWTVVDFLPYTASLIDEEVDTDHGILYNYSGAFKRKFPSRLEEGIFSKFLGQCVVIRVIDMNDECRIIGHKECPVKLERTGNRGTKPSDLAHHEFKYSVSQYTRAF